MPQSGDFSKSAKKFFLSFIGKVSIFYWQRMNIYCAFRAPLIPSTCEPFGRRMAADQAAEEYSAAFDSAAAFEVELVYRPIAFPDR